jgi:hypothetical protein
MRGLPGYSLVLLLAVVLIGTTPMGTGAGVHQLDLLHPLFSHVHVVNGRMLTHEQMQRGDIGAQRVSTGPALGAASGSNVADGDLGVVGTDRPVQLLVALRTWSMRRADWLAAVPLDRLEAPPDPPPTPSTPAA